MMRTITRFIRPALLGAVGATLVGLAVGGNGWAAESANRHETWNWSGTLTPGHTLAIHGVNGDIVAEPGTGDKVEVVAEKNSRKQDPANVRIKVNQDSDGITICAIYPGSNSPCENFHLGFEGRSNDVTVDFHVKVPAGVSFEASTVNGAVRARDLTGSLKANTVNGACEIETSGAGQASTVNGSVNARIGRLDPSHEFMFKTVNGSITLMIPAALDADFEGSTVNGRIEADFPVTVTGQWGPRHANATLGHGGPRLRASTVNGSIHLQKATAD